MKPTKLFIAFVFLSLLFSQADAGIIKKNIERFEYYLYIPKKYSPARPSPIIIALHSETDSSKDMIDKWKGAAEYYNYIVACPSSQNTDRWDTTDDLAILQMISEINDEFTIDRSNIFLTGSSTGGTLTYYLGLTYAGSFKAMAPFAGSLTQVLGVNVSIPSEGKLIPTLILHGKFDHVTEIGESFNARDKLRNNKYPVVLKELDGVGHEYPEKVSWIIIQWFENIRRESS